MSGKDDWDDHWDRYAVAASRNPGQVMRHALITRLLGQHRLGEKGTRLLDIGSGQGDLLLKVRPGFPSAEIVGLEMSRSGVEISEKKIPTARFFVADLFAPPPELSTLVNWGTHAVCSEVLEHVDDPSALLRAAGKYLSQGAILVVTVPGGPMSAFEKHIGHRQHFNRKSIARVLHEGGFEPTAIYMSGFPFFNLFRWTVLLRGKHVETDVAAENKGFTAKLAIFVMAVYRLLFRLNLMDHRWGWQVVAVGKKMSNEH
jgi:SAM-dependent methyltransferase